MFIPLLSPPQSQRVVYRTYSTPTRHVESSYLLRKPKPSPTKVSKTLLVSLINSLFVYQGASWGRSPAVGTESFPILETTVITSVSWGSASSCLIQDPPPPLSPSSSPLLVLPVELTSQYLSSPGHVCRDVPRLRPLHEPRVQFFPTGSHLPARVGDTQEK